MRKNIAILGSTGVIGQKTVEIIAQNPGLFRGIALSCHSKINLLSQQIKLLHPKIVCVTNEIQRKKLVNLIDDKDLEIIVGDDGLKNMVKKDFIDMVLIAIGEINGLAPLISAIIANKDIAFINKEAMVVAGHLIMPLMKQKKITLIPIDSEHNAIFQCLLGESKDNVRKLILTCSGGPFKRRSTQKLKGIWSDQLLQHPTWELGKKIAVDCASYMNKGLEVIEAHYLFDFPMQAIDVVVHPESIVHSLVEFIDGTLKAQLSNPDMRLPILYALTYPDRASLSLEKCDLQKMGSLHFEPMNDRLKQVIHLCKNAFEQGPSYVIALNSANNYAVKTFLAKKISFLEIVPLVEYALELHTATSANNLEEIMEIDHQAREICNEHTLHKKSYAI